MHLFRSVGILGSLVLVGMANLGGCSNAAREVSRNDVPEAKITLTTAILPPMLAACCKPAMNIRIPMAMSKAAR